MRGARAVTSAAVILLPLKPRLVRDVRTEAIDISLATITSAPRQLRDTSRLVTPWNRCHEAVVVGIISPLICTSARINPSCACCQ
eukprot:5712013-Pyramimonas_sp.AAC.1